MNPNRFFIPNMFDNPTMMQNAYIYPRNIGIFQRITNGIRSFNWNKLLTSANKTLNIMNQTIPLIRQTRPMINNVKSMINLARAFRTETKQNNHSNVNTVKSNNKYNIKYDETNQYPTFFV